jgi:formamidopyrimidine-DNA glycosylase
MCHTMPELPEVETVRRGLEPLLVGATIRNVQVQRHDLRTPIPTDFAWRLNGSRVLAIRRRAKYLLIDTSSVTVLSHLGMTGTWRLAAIGNERPHDHCYLELADGRRLAFRDPRRFGQLDFVAPGDVHPSLARLGPEPLSADFNVEYLRERLRARRQAVKVLIMDQAVVVGVGNIYAQEACFRAGILPGTPAGKLSRPRLATLIAEVRHVLASAIEAGGSTISDFRQAGGESGYFQHAFQVYNRAGQPCLRCAATLRGQNFAGRSTVWCPQCQR